MMDRHMDIAGSIFVVWLTTHANSPTRFNFTFRQIIAKKETLLHSAYDVLSHSRFCQHELSA